MVDRQRRLARLKTIEGHIRGVQRMEREGAYCIDLIKQTQAIHSALAKFNELVLEHHLANCVTDTIRSEDQHERERVVSELLQVYAPLTDEREQRQEVSIPRLDELQQVEAEVRAIQQLVEHDAYCIEVIRAAQAVQQALERFNVRILSDHLRTCVTDAIRGDEVVEREQKLRELLQVFSAASTLQHV